MAKLIDLTGQRFDKLIVLEKAPSRKRHTYWKCQCDCGNICEVSGEYLKKKNLPRSCGCHLKKNQYAKEIKEIKEKKDWLIGQRFGRLTVIERLNKSNNSGVFWRCKCDCGGEKEVPTSLLTSGHTQSCGCLKSDSHLIDITNQKFGKLTAIYYIPNTKKWHCKCECGNEKDIDGFNLRKGKTQSCGCINYSIGEKNIENILKANNIFYISQYTTNNLERKRFDFALINNDKIYRLIEFDGEQHYNDKQGLWGKSKETDSLEKIKERDEIKNKWAKENNIPLVRIPYWERDKITLEIILGDKYLI